MHFLEYNGDYVSQLLLPILVEDIELRVTEGILHLHSEVEGLLAMQFLLRFIFNLTGVLMQVEHLSYRIPSS